MWNCKDCNHTCERRSLLLKHSKLVHGHYGRGSSYPCTYPDCVCRFKTWNSLLSHLSQNHSTFKSRENISTFICPICGCNQESIPADFFKHIFGHLKNSETFTCVFKNCEYKTNVYEKLKRARRAEANFYPTLPVGETSATLERERLDILMEMQKRNNDQVVSDKMARTFAYRRQEVVDQQPRIGDFKDRWPALFSQRQVNEEFHRLVALPRESKFFEQLDLYSSGLLALARSKKGTPGDKIAPILHTFDQAEDINLKRECLLKALVIDLGEDTGDLVKEFVDIQQDDLQVVLEQVTIAVFSIRPEGCVELPEEDIGIVIEGVTVLNGLGSLASACALLLGLIYVLNLAYPKSLRYTFEVFQKVFMELVSENVPKGSHALRKTAKCRLMVILNL